MFENLNRADRRAMIKHAQAEALKRPDALTEIPNSMWPVQISTGSGPQRTKVWHSKRWLAQLFDEEPFQGIDTRRLSVCRVTLGADGHWDQNITWDDLYAVKADVGFADWYGIEIYPPSRHLVNVANMRHLWLLAEPIQIGWFKS